MFGSQQTCLFWFCAILISLIGAGLCLVKGDSHVTVESLKFPRLRYFITEVFIQSRVEALVFMGCSDTESLDKNVTVTFSIRFYGISYYNFSLVIC